MKIELQRILVRSELFPYGALLDTSGLNGLILLDGIDHKARLGSITNLRMFLFPLVSLAFNDFLVYVIHDGIKSVHVFQIVLE